MFRTLALLFCMGSLYAASELTCYTDVFAPYVIAEGEGVRGIDVEVLQQAAKRLGIKLNVKLLPWKRLDATLASGSNEIGCAFAFSRTAERERYLSFGQEALHITAYTLFVQSKRMHELQHLKLFNKTVVGVRRGFRLPAAIEQAVQSGKVILDEADQDEANFKKLAMGRIDAVLTNLDVGRYTLSQLNLGGISPQAEPVNMLPTYLVFSKSSTPSVSLAELDQALLKLKQDGTSQQIAEQYLQLPKN